MARPSDYTDELAALVCSLMTEGLSIKAICERDEMPDARTIYRWLGINETFRQNYAKAQQDRTVVFAEEILEIADDGLGDKWIDDEGVERVNTDVIARSRLRVDTRKWLMSKMDPKRYGDKVAMTDGDGGPLQVIVKQFTLAND